MRKLLAFSRINPKARPASCLKRGRAGIEQGGENVGTLLALYCIQKASAGSVGLLVEQCDSRLSRWLWYCMTTGRSINHGTVFWQQQQRRAPGVIRIGWWLRYSSADASLARLPQHLGHSVVLIVSIDCRRVEVRHWSNAFHMNTFTGLTLLWHYSVS